MADNRKDLDLIPAIAPAKDEVASYQRSGRAEAPKQSNFNGLLVFTLVLMALMMLVGGYTLFEVQKKLDEANTLLAQGQANIRDLEDRLSATGTDVSKTLQTLRSQQDANVSEIDKLWAIAYRQNRPKITALEKQVADIDGAAKKLNDQLTNQVASLNKVAARVDGVSRDNEDLVTSVSVASNRAQDLATQTEGLRRQILSLERKLNETDQAFASINQFRQQTNQQLIELQRQLRAQTGVVN